MSSKASQELKSYLDLVNPPTSTGNFSLPGASAASTKKLVEKLQQNFLENNAFFAGVIFHKYARLRTNFDYIAYDVDSHVMDHMLSLYSMGGTAEAIEEVYVSHDYEDPVTHSPEPITDENFAQHLGDAKYDHLLIVSFIRTLTLR
jgi:hypothetical protein